MKFIILVGVVQSFFLSLIVFTKKDKSTADIFLGFWFLFTGLHLLDYYSLSTQLFLTYPAIGGLGMNFPMLQGPFMFVYIQIVTSREGSFRLSYLLHALPFFLITAFLVSDFYLLEPLEKLAYFQTKIVHVSTPLLKIAWILNVFSGPVYVILSWLRLKKHASNIKEQFSSTEYINLNWLKYILVALGLVWVIVLFTMVLRNWFTSLSIGFTDHLIYYGLTITIFFLGYFGVKQKGIFNNISSPEQHSLNNLKPDTPQQQSYKKSGLTDDRAKELLNELLLYMDNEKPYLNNKLTLQEVANHLNISTNHLSQIINEQLHVNFFEFVNRYRLNEVKARLSSSSIQKFTILSIAFECGFNSKSGFNAYFKKETGLTPSAYIKAKYSA